MKRILVLLVCGMLVTGARASDLDFSGTFTRDDQVELINFTLGFESTITLFTSSWDDGGFDPVLTIWDGITGAFIGEQDDGNTIGSTFSNGTEYDHGDWDNYYALLLPAGDYTVSLSQYDNFANGNNLSDGFSQEGNPNFTQVYGPAPMFNGDGGSVRTGDWEFHILNVNDAPISNVPDTPATVGLLSLALLGLAGLRRQFC